MTFKQKLIYFFIAVVFYILLAALDFFVLSDFVSILSNRWIVRFLLFLAMIFVFNPILVYVCMNKIPFKVKGLKVEDGLQEALRQESGYKRS